MEIFRRAEARDIGEILRVIAEARAFMRTLGIDQWQDGYPEKEILLNDIEIGQLYVFSEGDHVRSVAALSLLPEAVYDGIEGEWLTGSGAKYLTVHRMAADDASRGNGLSARMMDEAERIARQNGCAAVRVDTHRGNVAMRRFLEKRGFTYCGIVHYFVKQGDPVRVAYEKLM